MSKNEGVFYIDHEGDPTVEYRTSGGDVLLVTFDRERKVIYLVFAGEGDNDLMADLPDEFMREGRK